MTITKKTTTMIAGALLAVSLAGCSAADVASENISRASDNFEVNRRVVFVNGITDKYLLSIEGLCSINASTEDKDGSGNGGQLAVTCKTGEKSFKKHYLGLSDNVTYFVEQIDSTNTDPYHYRVIFRPETIAPDIDLETSGS
ncbi:hypothetical protein NSA19_01090 [Actinomyces bowdenii]|uniref:beta-sandwich lipoprotein n=1 Tax=Actinomyces bowdenii TaxID=131109 RepID=UPI00214C65E6|nr:hypothetical protein [Actinomyces bowdenii]MCR2051472.1 hypothetical protein [Actinomyces bowdenii]